MIFRSSHTPLATNRVRSKINGKLTRAFFLSNWPYGVYSDRMKWSRKLCGGRVMAASRILSVRTVCHFTDKGPPPFKEAGIDDSAK
jgi:hypothetical protein